jgi:hypothetical protein
MLSLASVLGDMFDDRRAAAKAETTDMAPGGLALPDMSPSLMLAPSTPQSRMMQCLDSGCR